MSSAVESPSGGGLAAATRLPVEDLRRVGRDMVPGGEAVSFPLLAPVTPNGLVLEDWRAGVWGPLELC